MRGRWSRVGAMLGLLVAIISELRRRAWWRYRSTGLQNNQPTTTIVARRPAEARVYVPLVTAVWRPVAARALRVRAVSVGLWAPDDPVPVVWIDVAERPDIADLPRVLRTERTAGDDRPVVGTQWLADHEQGQVILVVTFVEPVGSTWALSFDMPRYAASLRRIVATGALFVAWSPPPDIGSDDDPDRLILPLPGTGLLISVNRTAQLRLMLAEWPERQNVS